MVIPRENNMVRLYIQIASSSDADWNPRKTSSVEEVQEHAKKIFKPYDITWDRVEWFSVYPIGQGIAEKYTLDERVFMGGDACHTHSPKAGQGMNTAFLDAVNLAWKIHHVEAGLASRSILKTYETERKLIANNLLNFDAKYAKLFSERLPSAGEVNTASQSTQHASSENAFVTAFKESCEFTSGYGVAYDPNIFNWSPSHPASSSSVSLFLAYQHGTLLRTGRILTASTVTRVVDANTVHLEQAIPLNGAFRIYIMAGVPALTSRALADFATHLSSKRSFLSSFLREDAAQADTALFHEQHAPHSRFFSFATTFNAPRAQIEIAEMLPRVLARYREHVYADDIWDQRVPDAKAAAHAKFGLDQERGGVVVVRPDGYVGCVVKLVEGAGTVEALNGYFGSFATKGLGGEGALL